MTQITQENLAAMLAAFVAAQQVEAPAETARAKRMKAMKIAKDDADTNVYEAEAEAADTGKDTLYALRHGAVSGYGAVQKYGVGMNTVFGKGWPLFTKEHPKWEAVQVERRAFVALGKSRGLTNPAVHWANAKKAALVASGHTKKGTPEPRAIKERLLDDCGKLYVAILRDADAGKQAANVRKAGELIAGAIQSLGGDLAPLVAQSKKALPGQPKGS